MRWLRFVGLIGGTLLGVVLGFGTFLYGGIPHGYDSYGIVAVPDRKVLDLPEGRVMLDHADDVEGCWNNTSHIENASIYEAPKGLAVKVSAVADGTVLPVTPVPRWLYSNITNCRGHEPFGHIEVPKAGRYVVETADAEHDGLSTKATSATGIALGPKPWAPFGSPVLAGLAVAVIAIGLMVVPSWVRRRR